tara:strand:- start:686 stop:1111 length:426 start_codon:yes stop_codon:yes gene_type:complete
MDLLRELVKSNLVFDGVSVEQLDVDLWQLKFPLGVIPAGTYKGGYWGDATIEDTDAVLCVTVGDLYEEDEFNIGEGTVNLRYVGDSGLAYTGELEELITDRIGDLYPGLCAGGSEQGMQGDDYLSLDLWTKENLDQTAYSS